MVRRPKARRVSRKLMLLTMALLVTVVRPCTYTTSFQASSHSCTFGHKGLESCKIENDIRLTVAPIGQDSCYSVKDSDGKPIGSVIVRTESIDLVCEPSIQYYVPEAEARCLSSRNCWKAGKCSGTTCEEWRTSDNIEGQPHSAYGTGWSYCEKVCGCAGCSCFYCLDSCLFYRKWLINPRKRVYTVSHCDQWFYEIELTITRATASEAKTERLVLRPGLTEHALEMDFTLISVSVPPQPVLSKCFISSDMGSSIGECNKRGEYSMGRIGEIQCNDYKSAENMESCLADQKIITIMRGSDTVTCRSQMVSPQSVMKISSLPLHLEGMMIAQNGSKLVASIHSIALLELQVTSDEMVFSRKTDKSACFVEVVSFAGCHACLTVNTDMGTAMGYIECESINMHTPVRIIKERRTINVTIHTNQPVISSQCHLRCPAGDAKFMVNGNLKYLSVPEARTSAQTTGIQINPKNTTIHLPSLAWNLMGGAVVKTLIVVALMLALILILYCIWSQRKRARKVRFSLDKEH